MLLSAPAAQPAADVATVAGRSLPYPLRVSLHGIP